MNQNLYDGLAFLDSVEVNSLAKSRFADLRRDQTSMILESVICPVGLTVTLIVVKGIEGVKALTDQGVNRGWSGWGVLLGWRGGRLAGENTPTTIIFSWINF
ncbi:hypothetical protein PL9631_1030087 [Planktothrix paucivesiculata PCC 9631]|uniref:Uncharacterized protein n=1 Tax=Planktothrix paucivesiculata PCC 9631 TaxID=671071 RepID=A0A7Z9BJE5_9CYAN|nr:hypothetical protein PL9631_1030087 [Planktothrix paucivesiculata PCC 9631]